MSDKTLQIPEEILESKLFKKLEKQMGDKNAREFCQQDEAKLRAVIAECEVQMEEARRQTQSNAAYTQAKGVLANFNGALRDAQKPLKLSQATAALIIGHRNELKKMAAKETKRTDTEA